jgi:hypothetical protein
LSPQCRVPASLIQAFHLLFDPLVVFRDFLSN